MRPSLAAGFCRGVGQTFELVVDERHEALRRKPVRLREAMDDQTIDECEEDVGLHSRVEVLAKLSRLLAFLKQFFEAATNCAIPPAVIEGERLIHDGAKNDAQPQPRGRPVSLGDGKDKEEQPPYPLETARPAVRRRQPPVEGAEERIEGGVKEV